MLFWKSHRGKLQIRSYNERAIPILDTGMTIYHQPPLLGRIPEGNEDDSCLTRYLEELSNYFKYSTSGEENPKTTTRFWEDLEGYSTHEQIYLSQIIIDLQQTLTNPDNQINLSQLIRDLKHCHEYLKENIMLSIMVADLETYLESIDERDYIVSSSEINFNRIISDLSSCIGYQTSSIKE